MKVKKGTRIKVQWPYSDAKHRWRKGEIIRTRKTKERYLIRFGDGDVRWSRLKDGVWTVDTDAKVPSTVDMAQSLNVKLPEMPAPLPDNEQERLRVLQRVNILDTPREPHFDKCIELAQKISECPVVLISFVDADRQWFKASIGFDRKQTCRSSSFCSHAVSAYPRHPCFIVPDTTKDPRFAGNSLVREQNIRFYAGFPLVVDGFCLGALCVKDRRPRVLSSSQKEQLHQLANNVSQYLALRGSNSDATTTQENQKGH